MKRALLSSTVALALALSFAATARAQSSDALEELLGQTIVSTPSRDSETDTTAPATSSVITAEQLRQLGIRSLDEAINYVSLGMVTSTSLHTHEIGARGVTINGDYGNHVLLLLDGHALNEAWNGTAYFERGAGIPFDAIDHIEVMLGPGSVMYGSQAMLGVINVVTKRAKDFQGVHLIAEGEMVLPSDRSRSLKSPGSDGYAGDLGGGYRVGAGYGRPFTIGGSPSELTLSLDYYRYRGPTWELGPQPYGDDWVTGAPKDFGPKAPAGVWGGSLRDADYLEAPAAYARFSTGDFSAALHASAYRRSTVFSDSLAAYAGDFDDPHNRELDRFLNLDLSQRFALTPRIGLVLRAFGDLYDYTWHNASSAAEDCPEGYVEGCDRTLLGVARGLGGEVQTQIQWPVLRGATLIGVVANARNVEDELTLTGPVGPSVAPLGGNRNDGLIAPYASQSLSPTRWLDLSLGLRLDHDTRFGDKLSPRTAAGVTPWRGGRLKVVYAEAFRAPSGYEMTYSDPNSQVPAPDLGPESVRSVQGSIEQRVGRHRLFFEVFRSSWSGVVGTGMLSQAELDAAIARGEITAGLTEAYRRENLGRIQNYGYNAAYEGAALKGRLRFGLNMTAARTRIDEGDGSGAQPPVVAPQAFGNARIAYDLPRSFPTLAVAARFTGRRPADRVYDGGFTPPPSAPPLLALKLAATGVMPAVPALRYRVGGEYSFAKVEPYVIGANAYANDNVTTALLAPTRRAHAFVGLEYAFGAPAHTSEPGGR
jgi:outer membrane receptor for ferrienterochelin and colicins